jgi:2-aminoadipate transaminase
VRGVLQESGPEALSYGESEGYAGLRQFLVKYMAGNGVETDIDDIIITDGGQQALDLMTKIFVDPGDVIIAEGPSYVGALNAFLSYQAKVIQVDMDNNGLEMDKLEQTLKDLRAKGITPKFIYVIPDFQNPGGVTLSLSRRKKLVKLAREYETLIFEDGAYQRLRFEGAPIPTVKSMDSENVVFIGTFSKILSPGLRVGWVVAPRPIREKFVFAKQAADLCSSSLTQRIIDEFFKETPVDSHIKKLITICRKRRDVMLEALKEYFPAGTKWTYPKGGFFVWATLPDYIDTTDMLAKAIQEKVAYVPGKAFYADGMPRNTMRLNYSYPKEKDIREGIRRLAEVIDREMELYRRLKI